MKHLFGDVHPVATHALSLGRLPLLFWCLEILEVSRKFVLLIDEIRQIAVCIRTFQTSKMFGGSLFGDPFFGDMG